MTVRRAVTLGALVAALIGTATGLSHIGHSTLSPCTGTWRVILNHATDQTSTSTQNARAVALVPTVCTGAAKSAHGGWDAYAVFDTQSEAAAYAQQLVNAGYVTESGYQPTVVQVEATPTP